jgi:hypothetical protein
MPLAGFERAVSANERPQTHALDRAVTGIGFFTVNTVHVICTDLYCILYPLSLASTFDLQVLNL